MTFDDILEKYRSESYSKRNTGKHFEELMAAWLITEPTYKTIIDKVWMWADFPYRDDFGSGKDVGIDIVAYTTSCEYWAVQCKCYAADTAISKADVDTFISTSGKTFRDNDGEICSFSNRLWIDTSSRWTSEAENVIRKQAIPVNRITYDILSESHVDWEKLENDIHGSEAVSAERELRPHQQEALNAFHEHFKTADRGQLIMACGTGKTFTSLRIAENEVPEKGIALFLVPSIALLNQTLIEWMTFAKRHIYPICICSDPDASKRKKNNDDSPVSVEDLALPATTDANEIARRIDDARNNPDISMIVIFSTYQSIEEVSNAQKAINGRAPGSCDFYLVICDEAHRTTGMAYYQTKIKIIVQGTTKDTETNEKKEAETNEKQGTIEKTKVLKESSFIRVHDDNFIKAKKRLYMTATPRLYTESVKKKADSNKDKIPYLCSMDDVDKYGKEVYRIGFGKAVSLGLLSDYKVLVLTIEADSVPEGLRRRVEGALEAELESITDEKERERERKKLDKELKNITQYIAKLIGSTNALSKRLALNANLVKDTDPALMKTAVAFCQNIRTSKLTTTIFNACAEPYNESLPESVRSSVVEIEADHVDGTMSAIIRQQKLKWLKDAPNSSNDKICRILTNVRCLSEGVDVPALDAVIFLSERNSQIDVVQSVGRVMRRAPGKKYGYIIIPVVIPEGKKPEEELDKGSSFHVVWTVLNALRAHDDRFDAEVNKLDLTRSTKISVVPVPPDPQPNPNPEPEPEPEPIVTYDYLDILRSRYGEFVSSVYARMVEKVGTRAYWEIWAKDVADVAQKHQFRIQKLINERADYKEAFNKFLEGLKEDINPGIKEKDVVEMLAQHIITRPIFEALFENYSFAANNPVSRAMEQLLALIKEDFPEDERKKMDEIIESIRNRCSGIDNAEGRQRVIIELYNKFFMAAFPKTVAKLGIVYTPVEIVDFILRSADDILRREFGRALTDENVHILDPFTGTGTFITRLLQSGLIRPEDLKRKYEHEIHANEIVLLAYYIASINIENIYHDVSKDTSYSSFNGICLTDTFNLYKKKKEGQTELIDTESESQKNSARVLKQKKTPIQVIVGNPPYSAGQGSANDDAQNEHYENLEGSIAKTYVKHSKGMVRSLYDSYIKAFRWASDRISSDTGGIIAFVSNGSWLDDNSKSGVRKSFEKEFSKIYVFNLRGNQRTSGELSRREGGKIFGSGSRAPISITILVKKPDHTETDKAEIFYHDIGDYLSREEKLKIIRNSRSALSGEISWTRLESNEYDDWINKRSTQYVKFPVLGDKKGGEQETYFVPRYSRGCMSSRDAWVYNFSSTNVKKNMLSMIDFYNNCVKSRAASGGKDITHTLDGFDINDAKKIGWDGGLKDDYKKGKIHEYKTGEIRTAMYRPFTKEYHYFNGDFNWSRYLMPQLFPTPNHENRLICVSGIGVNKDFSALMVNCIPDLEVIGKSQCFPLYYYEKDEKAERKVQAVQTAEREVQAVQTSLFGSSDEKSTDEYSYILRRSGVSEYIVRLARKKYDRPGIKDEDIFYYVYGMLHSRDYRKRFAADLKKSLPRLPLVESYEDFCTISRIGRELGNMHTDYENERRANVTVSGTGAGNFHVSEMRFGRTVEGKVDKSRIIYNGFITISDIPLRAYDYIVNGKSAIEWLMERYAVTIDRKSQLVNDPNDWANEHGNPRYILDLLLSVISLSVRTMELVDRLPKLSFDEE